VIGVMADGHVELFSGGRAAHHGWAHRARPQEHDARAAADDGRSSRPLGCTLVTTVEPCAWLRGTRVLWRTSAARLRHRGNDVLLALTGNMREPDARPACRHVFARGQKTACA
jgi:hypothetical protein